MKKFDVYVAEPDGQTGDRLGSVESIDTQAALHTATDMYKTPIKVVFETDKTDDDDLGDFDDETLLAGSCRLDGEACESCQ